MDIGADDYPRSGLQAGGNRCALGHRGTGVMSDHDRTKSVVCDAIKKPLNFDRFPQMIPIATFSSHLGWRAQGKIYVERIDQTDGVLPDGMGAQSDAK